MSENEPVQATASTPEAQPADLSQAVEQVKETSAASGSTAAVNRIDDAELTLFVEAILMTTDRALPTSKITELIAGSKARDITSAIARLNEQYEQTGRSFRIEELAGGWQMMTLPRFAGVLANLHKSRTQAKLSPAALETLAIVAYKQPILRAEIETIRGVASGEVLRSLMERRLVKIVGRADEIGRPMLYGTTKVFLEMYGLASLKDLPKVEDLKQPG